MPRRPRLAPLLLALLALAPATARPADGLQDRLVAAAGAGDEAAVASLLRAGAKVNEPDSGGRLALHAAILADRYGVVVDLLKAGADVQKEGINRAKAIHAWALISGRDEENILGELRERGATLEDRFRGDWTPLMLACSRPGIGQILIPVMLGADVNARAKNGDTALLLAAKNNPRLDEKIGDLWGGDVPPNVNARNDDGQTALMFAAAGDGFALVRRLLDAGADARTKDGEGKDALAYVKDPATSTVREVLADAIAGKYDPKKKYGVDRAKEVAEETARKAQEEKALKELEAAEQEAAAKKTDVALWSKVAGRWFGRKDGARAIAVLDRAIGLNPGQIDLLRARGIYHQRLGHRDAALSDYGRATNLDPADYEAWWGIGSLHCAEKNRAEGLPALRRAAAAYEQIRLREQARCPRSERDDDEEEFMVINGGCGLSAYNAQIAAALEAELQKCGR